ncbi:hypothetical protein GCM10011403_05250 [Pseudohongiella nitratireducens]|uniref:Uncharacterized protein n=1 Tax=Pseudohongiella nitratireducens TaxID=1768907 RepID=A0A917GMG8_9GAMM|nr:hypothetical protein GCM10011403_05250 [Pseudohongiella nitratireducens]
MYRIMTDESSLIDRPAGPVKVPVIKCKSIENDRLPGPGLAVARRIARALFTIGCERLYPGEVV